MRDKIRTYVFDFKTENEFGFNPSEIQHVIKHFQIPEDVFNEALGVNTVMMNERGETIYYHVDIEQALRVVLEGKQTPFWIWD